MFNEMIVENFMQLVSSCILRLTEINNADDRYILSLSIRLLEIQILDYRDMQTTHACRQH